MCNNSSDSFPVTRGVRQGGILSPLLFNEYTNPMIKKLIIGRDYHAMKLVMPHTNSCFGNSAFSVGVPTLWNLLPNIIRTTTSRSQFKSRLFRHYLVK